MTTRGLVTAVLVAVTLSHCEGFKFYQDQIPNGDRVPHPCKPNFLWEGVGHKNIGGGGNRNPFGRDFELNDFKWDACLCGHDSDGDGKTNGEELGDPNCVWKEGDIPEKLAGLSHPGVCQPVDSPLCKDKNDWSFCDYKEFNCDSINETDVIEVILKYPKTQVPAQETTYLCMHFDLPSDQDYHVIAAKALIDNKNVMHHIILAGCEIEDDDDQSWRLNEPQECGMATTRCAKALPGWTVGHEGDCTPDIYGYRVGKSNRVKTVIMQFHWNNPQKASDYFDESGMALYLTPTLRTYDAGYLALGTTYLNIPPAVASLSHDSYCKSECTQHLPESVYFSEILFHMHYLGIGGIVEHIRDGDVIQVIKEEDYSYDNPIVYRFDPPIEFLPGDELKTTCTFKSTSRNTFTYYGAGTSDEMCFAFITYYPVNPNFGYCLSYQSVDLCSFPQHNNSCNFEHYLTETQITQVIIKVETFCNSTNETCPNGCEQALAEIRDDNPCFREDQADFVENEILVQTLGDYGKKLVILMHSCEPDWKPDFPINVLITDPDNNTKRNATTPTPPSDGDSANEECIFGQLNGATKTNVAGIMWLLIVLVIMQ